MSNPIPRRASLPDYHFDHPAIDAAHAAWGCNCGPGALAMMLCLQLEDVRTVIPEFDEKRYTNWSMMRSALDALKVPFHDGPRRFSTYGLVRIQWGGPWCTVGARPSDPVKVGKWGYRFSHWIGSMGDQGKGNAMIFDINGGWMLESKWKSEIVPMLTELYPRSDGQFHITHNLEIDLPVSGTCRACGCTDLDCTECVKRTGMPCHWTDATQTLCSACLETRNA